MNELYGDALPEGFKLGPYEIQDILGVGGFGITYRAYDHLLKQIVAIKEYLPSGIATRHKENFTVKERSESNKEFYQYGLSRFLEEARVLAKFRNPNIVRVIRYIQANGTAYLVMDFEQGTSLSDLLKKNTTLDEERICSLLVSLLNGLHSVHEQGFLHRDIKPGNILIRDDKTIVLLDFGSARQALSQKNIVLTTVLTPGYAPFEQYSNDDQQGPWTDLYSLGATIFHCITGNQPTIATKRLAAAHENKPDPIITALHAVQERYSSELITTIIWTMEPDPNNRPQTVDVVLQRINESYQNKEKKLVDFNTAIYQKVEAKTALSIPAEYLEQLRVNLINQLGPIADVLIRKALKESSSLEELNEIIANNITSERQKTQFLNITKSVDKSKINGENKIKEVNSKRDQLYLDDGLIKKAQENLAFFIGPIANIFIKKAVNNISNRIQFINYLADKIDNEKQRSEFIRKMEL